MVKTEAMDPELRGIGWCRFNFTKCTDYYPKRYYIGTDLLIHKYPNDFGPHRLIPIILSDIEADLHHKHLGKIKIKTAEELNAFATEQYGSRKTKAADI